MAITVIEQGSASQINGSQAVNTFVNALQENDLVVLQGGHPRESQDVGPNTAGYTEVIDVSHSAGSARLSVAYKFMSASPDTSVAGMGSGNSLDACSYGYIVLRGVDTVDPLAGTPTTAEGTGAVDPPSMTTDEADAYVLTGLLKNAVGISSGPPTGYGDFTATSGNDTNDACNALAGLIKAVAGAEDPGVFQGITGAQNWVAFTMAFKPAAVAAGDPFIPQLFEAPKKLIHRPWSEVMARTLFIPEPEPSPFFAFEQDKYSVRRRFYLPRSFIHPNGLPLGVPEFVEPPEPPAGGSEYITRRRRRRM